MEKCKTCKWWGEPIPKEWAAAEWDFSDKRTEVLRICGRPSTKERYQPYEDDDYSYETFVYRDWIFCDYDMMETHEACMSGPDFGCIHFEPKDKEDGN